MQKIHSKIDQVIYGYDPTEFMPIRVDGRLANWDQFVAYKLQCVVRRAVRAI